MAGGGWSSRANVRRTLARILRVTSPGFYSTGRGREKWFFKTIRLRDPPIYIYIYKTAWKTRRLFLRATPADVSRIPETNNGRQHRALYAYRSFYLVYMQSEAVSGREILQNYNSRTRIVRTITGARNTRVSYNTGYDDSIRAVRRRTYTYTCINIHTRS